MPADLITMTRSLNALLADVYGTEKRVSGILTTFGMEQKCIDELKGEKLEGFYRNIMFALECRFLHYSGGYRLLDVLCRRYGLFGCGKETLEVIGESLGVSRERVRQLQNKAIKRMVGGVSADATGILLLLCACHTLKLDVATFLGNIETPEEDVSDDTKEPDDDDEAKISRSKESLWIYLKQYFISPAALIICPNEVSIVC